MNVARNRRALASSPLAPSKRKIAVISNVGNLNLGDEAILRSTLQALRKRLSDAQIQVYTINPPETSERHRVDTAPLRSRVKGQPAAQIP